MTIESSPQNTSTGVDIDGAVAFLESEAAGETPAAETPAEGTPAVPDPNAVELPGFAALEEKAKARAAERAQREAAEAPIRALEEKLAGITGPSVSVAQLHDDPVAALMAAGVDVSGLQAKLAKLELAPDPNEQMRAMIRSELEPFKPKASEATPEGVPLAEAQSVFASAVAGGGDRYPVLSRIPPAIQGQIAWDYVQNMRASGIDTTKFTDERIATAIELQLSSGTPQAANGTTQVQSPGTPTTANGGPTTSAPRSITNGLAADGQRRPPETDAEFEADAVAHLQSLLG